ncbi:class I SAM-dependent methyltransferase [Limnospira fusiformis]|uniref:class I SAM-dependent methyltransferase n=1 Tax=Limnospira fusiformis TaxID=54297 RepID=UPI0034E08E76
MNNPLSQNPFEELTSEDFSKILDMVQRHPMLLMQIDSVRALVAQKRLDYYLSQQPIERIGENGEASIHNTISYNIRSLAGDTRMLRPLQLIGPLRAIEKVFMTISNQRVLTIGPRSEMEIFSLYAAGFSPKNITAIDLLSYSPLVELGDMHTLPYPDDSFDVVILGWVLSYSKEPNKASAEILRCTRSGGLVAIGNDYAPRDIQDTLFSGERFHFENTSDLLALFGDCVGQVYFRHDPDNATAGTGKQLMTIFEIKKGKGINPSRIGDTSNLTKTAGTILF